MTIKSLMKKIYKNYNLKKVDFLLSQFSYCKTIVIKKVIQICQEKHRVSYDRLSTQFKVLKPEVWTKKIIIHLFFSSRKFLYEPTHTEHTRYQKICKKK